MLIHGLVGPSRVNGPGFRAVVFFQGCTLGCRGCWNPDTHEFRGVERNAVEITERINAIHGANALDGVTFSGGEPMQQASAVLTIIRELRRRSPKLSFGMFTGYTERELEQGRFSCLPEAGKPDRFRLWHAIRSLLDFAIMGRYNQAQPASGSLCSSRNQVLRLYSDRYSRDDFGPQELEVVIAEDGLVQITGFPVLGLPA